MGFKLFIGKRNIKSIKGTSIFIKKAEAWVTIALVSFLICRVTELHSGKGPICKKIKYKSEVVRVKEQLGSKPCWTPESSGTPKAQKSTVKINKPSDSSELCAPKK